MKKVVFAAAAIAAGVLALTGCSKKEGASVKKSNEKVVLTVWESLQGPDEFIRQAGDAYSKSHPNVEIKFVNVELGDAAGQIALDGPAGVGPDIFAAPHDKLGELVNGGHILPTVNADAVKQAVLGACSQALTYDGKMYGYPISAETYALFYNKDLISESDVPKTWDDLAKWTKAFNAKNSGKRGFVMDVGNGYYTILFTTAGGNRLFGTSGTDTSSSYLNTANAVNGMKLFQSLKDVLNVPAADLDTGNCDAAFQGGNAAMHITGPWNIKNFKDAGLNFGVAPLPALPGDKNPASSFSGTRAMFVSAYSDYPAEAADFAQFLISASMQQLRFDLTGAMPSIDTPVSNPYIGGFLKQLDYAFPMPSIPEMAKFWETMGNTSKNIWDGADAQTELDACNAAIISK
ncbi:maltose ABC transporter substrate-binding protein [Treponema sp.]|uniref:sugar ABC transporter substrate-binding protein n=1 Tax=Treponema sp. TaxID=166 RepID=UPI00298DB586|nr:maltose ABC transporter substrate-binding protein [Treponema sp.]MCI6441865.1 maltose ABC transporter substrate-binding protein [Spirochaetia bacterium]MDY4131821.1 maltose ABC transporter substrate-binding protein [Treponema sp.]